MNTFSHTCTKVGTPRLSLRELELGSVSKLNLTPCDLGGFHIICVSHLSLVGKESLLPFDYSPNVHAQDLMGLPLP